ncbi:MAG: NAD-dependent epimerase/dehydratase family protein [Simkaniaceae bacterium]|nr:MAG: NAD-dependent epimerase/dehydratase family protein [Simkaniaceae bacterium]
MRILLIGSGYVGMALLVSWTEEEDYFVATTTTEAKLQEIQEQPNVDKAYLIKITETTNLKFAFDECDAAIVTIAPTNDSNYKETYLDGAIAISKALKGRTNPLFLLYTSSTSVYGNHSGVVVDEISVRKPLSKNGEILSEVEDIFFSCHSSNIEVCILRLGGIYGPMRTLDKRARKMSNKNLSGLGTEVTNHIHLEDITHAIQFCVNNRLKGIYNLVGDDHPSRQMLYEQISLELKIPPPVWGGNLDSIGRNNAIVSNEKIKACGYIFKYPHLPFSFTK